MDNNALISGFDDTTNDSLSITLSSCEELKDGVIITLNGYIDIYTSQFFQEKIEKIVNAGYINLIFVCKNLNYVSSTGIGVFSSLLKNIKLQSGDIILVEMPEKVLEVFQLLGFAQLFSFRDSVESAIGFFHQEVETEVPVFPMIFSCPVCSKRLKTTSPGRFRCSECKSILAVDEQGKVLVG
ncbi:MAG: STAS domain-containing protein [Treponema sp.]|nr:STAS domain-containing protein [Spirochaetaceae bacterium]MEE0133517.1 STAS domain-containing protein [Treponema sp.]